MSRNDDKTDVTVRISQRGTGLLNSYLDSMEELRLKYHTYPEPYYRSQLPTQSESQSMEAGHHRETANQIAAQYSLGPGGQSAHVFDAHGHDLGPSGKVVV